MKYITKLVLIIFFPLIGSFCSKSENRPTSGVEANTTPPMISLSYAQRQGKELYNHYCAVCHGESGAGDGFNSYNLNPRPRDFTDRKYMNSISEDRLLEIIYQGGRGSNKSNLMPSWGGTLKEVEISNIINYLSTLSDTVDKVQ